MNEPTKPERSRITAARLVICGFLAAFVSGLFHTPGAWSDVHSQWFPALVRAVASLGLFIATHWVYLRSRPEAIALWFVFGTMFTDSLYTLVVSQRFLYDHNSPGPFDYLQHPSHFFDFPWGNF